MKQNRFSEEQIIAALKQIEGGRTAAGVGRELGVSKRDIAQMTLFDSSFTGYPHACSCSTIST
jgi:hypothetical protein